MVIKLQTMPKIRVAQLGVGYWGPNLLRNLVNHERFEVAGVVELSASRRDYVKTTYPAIKVCSSVDEVLLDPNIDALIIATPVHTHADLALRALNAGKHILVEKPLASSVQDAEEIAYLSRQKKLVAMSGHTFLFNSAVRFLKDLINNGELGQVRYVYSQRLNLGRIRSDVDALWNLAPHDVSIVQYLFGDPTPLSVTRAGMDYVQRGIDDVVFLNITYPNKVLVNIHVSWLDPQRVRKMVVVGSDKMAIYDDAQENKIMICDKGIDRMAVLGENMDYDTPPAAQFGHRSGKVITPKINYTEPLNAELSHFAECIHDGVECLTGPEHAIKVIRILTAGTRRKTEVYAVDEKGAQQATQSSSTTRTQ